MNKVSRFLRDRGPSLYSIPLLLLLWQIAATMPGAPRMLPGVDAIFVQFVSEVQSGVLLFHAWVSAQRFLAGYLLAVVVGVPLGIAMARSRIFELLTEPVFFAGYPVPKIALYPVFVFIFGIGTLSKVAFVFLECLYPITTTAYFAFRSIDTRLIWTARNMGASRLRIFFGVMLPAAAPGIFSGLRIAMPIAIVVVIITEMIGDSRGLGYYVTISSARFRYENIYAGIAMIGVLGFMADRAIHYLRKWVVYWDSFAGVREK
jgi:NitT/TauT family transport system permease protein